jgi:hypothetical protein
MSAFSADIFQNQYLPLGGTAIDAIIRVDSNGLGQAPAPNGLGQVVDLAEVIIVDVSGSMEQPRSKLSAAKSATAAAIDCLREGARFAVIAGSHRAEVLYPVGGGLAVADDRTRREACAKVGKLRTMGGTAIGTWLRAADDVFAAAPASIHHAILLTDGQNEGESAEDLAASVAQCEGRFQCDCRGVGDGWDVDELRGIATALLGTVDIIPDPSDMTASFTTLMHTAMGRSVATATLRVWTPKDAGIEFIKQVAPELDDLTPRRVPVSDLVGEYPTGAWGDESRDYHLRIRVPAHEGGREMLAGRVHLVVDDEPVTEAKILAVWTDDEALSTRIDREVARATGQAEIAAEIQIGIKAWELGDHDTATRHLGRATKLAHDAGDEDRLDALQQFVEVDDPATGTVHIRSDARKIDAMTLDTQSTKTVRRVSPDAASVRDGP